VVKAFVASATIATAACSVPPLSLEGKGCPCATEEGYVCDEITKLCLRTNDGGTIIDTPASESCLSPMAMATSQYQFGGGMLDWATRGGTWVTSGTEIRQTDKMADALAYRTSADLRHTNVHVISTMRETDEGNGGNPMLGIAFRISLDGQTRYRCAVGAGQLYIERVDANGTAMVGTPATLPTLPMTFTMEAAAIGSSLSCCIRGVTQARVMNATDTAIAMGFSGLETERKAAVFPSFVVYGRP
jgi:hypothetical protein